MTPATTHVDGLLRALSQRECWDLLSSHHVGRISYVDGDGPTVLPLNYVAFEGGIWIRTASYNQLAVHLSGQAAAFEIDHTDVRTQSGWSVLVRGQATHVLRATNAPPGWQTSNPWPDGPRSMTFRIEPRTVTGRALKQADVRPGPGSGPGTIQRSPGLKPT